MLKKITWLLIGLLVFSMSYADTVFEQAEQDLRHNYRSFKQFATGPASYYCKNKHWPNTHAGIFHQRFKPSNGHYNWDLRIKPTGSAYTFTLRPIAKNSAVKLIGHAQCQAQQLSSIKIEVIAPGSKQNHTTYQI